MHAFIMIIEMGCISPSHPPPERYRPNTQVRSYQSPPQSASVQQQFTSPKYQPPPTQTPVMNGRQSSARRQKIQYVQANYNEQSLMNRYGIFFQKNMSQMVDVKVPTTPQKIQFAVSKQPLILLPVETGNYPSAIVKNLCFQEKMTWMRIQVEKMRISWEQGCQWLHVDRHEVLMSSYHTLQTINLRKQLKIKLNGEEVDDAGGVLREWMHLCVRDVFSSNIAGLFKLCKTDETAYRFVIEHINSQSQDEFRMDIAYLLGIIIGKAIFDRIPLDCFLNRSIWRLICSQQVQYSDLYSYDKDIYRNLKVILQTPGAEELAMNFTYFVGDQAGKEEEIILKPNGKQIPVNDSNKRQYVEALTNYLCVKSCQRYIKRMREAISKIMPLQILSVFEPHEMQMLLNGPQNINVIDWKNSTQYVDYQTYDSQIQWFWSYVEQLNQQKLGNLLHFVTGSRRVPILGFSFLESNRNKVNKFTIQRSQIEEHNPYPKAHTCFNRLQLPTYRTQAELNQRMTELLANQINSFGMS